MASQNKLDDKRLYIGNLDSAIDEYTVVKLFEPFGKITQLDYLFHKSGPKRGQPRGYCFLEYSRKDEALRAMTAMHSKVIKNRSMIVTFAYSAPDSYDGKNDYKKRSSTSMLLNRPTTISLLKSHKMVNASTDAKIQALERKLAQMNQQKSSSDLSSNSPSQQPITIKSSSSSFSSKSIDKDDRQRFKPYETYRIKK
ncbi:5536_t:CDS:2 [Diversispora eburnea]|uniref:Probable RNA-binding protein 18 n=1 Tax=Diversispora eburnea TaxID=1213867 RepID=A0A9N8V5C0_9GLOM|nr:5536_t:CDS:2 [Diversispora eburnea]